MKPLFKFCLPKILFFLLVINTGIRPAAMVPAVIATEELTVLAVMGAAAIHEMLVQYRQCDKSEDEIFLVNVPEANVPIQSIPVAGKSDEEIVAEVTQAVTRAIGMKHSLSRVDQSKLDNQLRSKKLGFINTIAHNRSWEQAQHRLIAHRATIGAMKNANSQKGRILQNQAVDDFAFVNAVARHPANWPTVNQHFENMLNVFIDCNSRSYARRIEARIKLSEIAKCNSHIFGYGVKEAVLNLQARYFDKNNHLIDISYDMRLPETMKMFLRESPYFWNDERKLKELYDYVERFDLDPEDSFKLMRQRGSGELRGEAKKRSYKKCKLQTLWGKGKIFPYPDKFKKIFNEPENWKLFRVAALCEQGQFEEALSIANRFRSSSTVKSSMMNVINHYRQDPVSLAPNSDSPSTEQLIVDIAPPPLPPDQDPNKDKKQEYDREQAKKKNARPVPPERENEFSDQKEKLKHNWDKREGHVEETPENKKSIYDTANDPECYCGPPDQHGNHWYTKILEDGRQVWARVRDNKIVGWGINKAKNIIKWNSKTGLTAPKAPSQKIPKLSKSPGKSWKLNL